MDRGAWWPTVHEVAKSRTRLSNFTFTFTFCEAHTISVLYCVLICMKCSLGISNFLEEISSLSLPIVFLYFFALITDESILCLHFPG